MGGSSFQGGCVTQGHSARDISHRSTLPLGRGALKEGCVWGEWGGNKDGDANCATTTRMVAQTEWLQRSLLVLRQEEKKGFLGPELKNSMT